MLCLSAVSVKAQTSSYQILRGSNFQINGKTNVNRFTCTVKEISDTIKMVSLNSWSSFKIPVKKFTSPNIGLIAELKKTLKDKTYPYVIIQIISMDKPLKDEASINAKVLLTIAGLTKLFPITIFVSQLHDGSFQVRGNQRIKFSDFNLDPPQRLGGKVRTSQDLDIAFHLHLKAFGDDISLN